MTEINFDGIVGPTHHYGGLSYGNVASEAHRHSLAHPKEAALQGLRKMKALTDMGIPQAVLPPQERPDLSALRLLGFSGSDKEILLQAKRDAPDILTAVASASSMWTANAATVSPSADSSDGKVHFTPANLISNFHRSLEPPTTSRVLRAIFADAQYFTHHNVLPATTLFSDEGAANHTRLCKSYDQTGLQLFVYGKRGLSTSAFPHPKNFPARQSLEASQAIARRHKLTPENTLFAQQNPHAIDQGVFHNDVIAVGNQHVFLYHEEAFIDTPAVIQQLSRLCHVRCGIDPNFIKIRTADLSIKEAVASYLFNSQIVTLPDSTMALIAPAESQEMPHALACIESIISDDRNPISKVIYFNLRQSMNNGGGPACLRLRVALNDAETASIKANVFLTDSLYKTLEHWIQRHYRDQLTVDDLLDPNLHEETKAALDELTGILKIGSVYPFQQ